MTTVINKEEDKQRVPKSASETYVSDWRDCGDGREWGNQFKGFSSLIDSSPAYVSPVRTSILISIYSEVQVKLDSAPARAPSAVQIHLKLTV